MPLMIMDAHNELKVVHPGDHIISCDGYLRLPVPYPLNVTFVIKNYQLLAHVICM